MQYIYYEEIVPAPQLTDAQVEELLARSLQHLLASEERIRASVLRQPMSESSNGVFDKSHYAEGSFRKFLEKYPALARVEQVETTIYVKRPEKKEKLDVPQHIVYRRELKKQRLRVIRREVRFTILKDMIRHLAVEEQARWRELIDTMAEEYKAEEKHISKNAINAVMLLARRAQVIDTLKAKSLSTAPVMLRVKGAKALQDAHHAHRCGVCEVNSGVCGYV